MKKYIIPIICLLSFIIFIWYKDNKIKNYKKQIIELNEVIEQYKQAANPSKESIDSLVYDITYRDSIIYNIKQKYVEDVEIVKNMPDSDAVNLFKKLVWAD
ncbi:MAG: hypothetical protein J6M39_06820 [Lachnospiraceae bacterium]|nr:hypothetical protein [Lachnospiraceae bacterium]